MGKMKKKLFTHSRNFIEAKLNMNNHLMVGYTILICGVDQNSKMAVIAGQTQHRKLWENISKLHVHSYLKLLNH